MNAIAPGPWVLVYNGGVPIAFGNLRLTKEVPGEDLNPGDDHLVHCATFSSEAKARAFIVAAVHFLPDDVAPMRVTPEQFAAVPAFLRYVQNPAPPPETTVHPFTSRTCFLSPGARRIRIGGSPKAGSDIRKEPSMSKTQPVLEKFNHRSTDNEVVVEVMHSTFPDIDEAVWPDIEVVNSCIFWTLSLTGKAKALWQEAVAGNGRSEANQAALRSLKREITNSIIPRTKAISTCWEMEFVPVGGFPMDEALKPEEREFLPAPWGCNGIT